MDGRVSLSGYRTLVLDVEVTCTYSYEESLRAELLNKDGVAPGAGPIARAAGADRIIAETVALDINEHYPRLANEIIARARGKLSWKAARPSVLIVVFDEIRVARGFGWLPLHKELATAGGVPKGPFTNIYLFNSASAEVQRAA